jgi:formiminotetrahydrofolate cyclodeaminase
MSTSFLDELAQARPDPGGGAAAAYGAALGLALLEKVVRLEARRPQAGNPGGPPWEKTLGQVGQLAAALDRLRQEDVQAYLNLTRARAAGDTADLAAALREAVLCPVRIILKAQEALSLVAWAGQNCRAHLISDLLVAAELINAALMGAYHIACANLPLIKEAGEGEFLARELVRVCRPACELFQKVKVELVAREHGVDHCG